MRRRVGLSIDRMRLGMRAKTATCAVLLGPISGFIVFPIKTRRSHASGEAGNGLAETAQFVSTLSRAAVLMTLRARIRPGMAAAWRRARPAPQVVRPNRPAWWKGGGAGLDGRAVSPLLLDTPRRTTKAQRSRYNKGILLLLRLPRLPFSGAPSLLVLFTLQLIRSCERPLPCSFVLFCFTPFSPVAERPLSCFLLALSERALFSFPTNPPTASRQTLASFCFLSFSLFLLLLLVDTAHSFQASSSAATRYQHTARSRRLILSTHLPSLVIRSAGNSAEDAQGKAILILIS
jgi:hypothetical protein